MHIKKRIQSTTDPLEELLEKGENLDFRLDEVYWEDLRIGDYIQYWEDFTGWDKEPSKNARRVVAQICKIIKASTFTELMEKCESVEYDEQEKQKIFQHLRNYWTHKREREVGVLGLYVKI